MKITQNDGASMTRAKVESTTPSGGLSNVTQDDSDMTLMNLPSPALRSQRADALIETMGTDTYSLTPEKARNLKMKG